MFCGPACEARHVNGRFIPTPEQIAERAATVRARWTVEDFLERAEPAILPVAFQLPIMPDLEPINLGEDFF